MPIHFTIYPENRILHSLWTAPLTMREIAQSLEDTLVHPDFVAGTNLLMDLRQTDAHHFTYDDINEMAGWIPNNADRFIDSHWAVVCQEPMQTALSMLFKTATVDTPLIIEIFSEMENAIDWLELNGSKVAHMGFE